MKFKREGVGFVVVGLLMFSFGAWQGLQAYQSTSWPKADGIVLKSTTVSSRSGRRDKTTAASVTYQYEVAGVKYENDVVRIGQIYVNSAFGRASKIARSHSPGPATISYHPRSPEKSVLEPGFHTDNLLVPIVGSVFAFVGLCIFRHASGARRSW